jgi:hypothetical protein
LELEVLEVGFSVDGDGEVLAASGALPVVVVVVAAAGPEANEAEDEDVAVRDEELFAVFAGVPLPVERIFPFSSRKVRGCPSIRPSHCSSSSSRLRIPPHRAEILADSYLQWKSVRNK